MEPWPRGHQILLLSLFRRTDNAVQVRDLPPLRSKLAEGSRQDMINLLQVRHFQLYQFCDISFSSQSTCLLYRNRCPCFPRKSGKRSGHVINGWSHSFTQEWRRLDSGLYCACIITSQGCRTRTLWLGLTLTLTLTSLHLLPKNRFVASSPGYFSLSNNNHPNDLSFSSQISEARSPDRVVSCDVQQKLESINFIR